ncbi:non-ribosomal peptide synthetase [Micromonospora sp. DT233]|uniref:non-ribosomal peptide synthetase n=1 Tax=Micromonospora sp. DT233 TaxID=3393432 RepID=UPI003CF66F59
MDQRNDGLHAPRPGAAVHALFEQHAQAAPDRVAVVAGAESLTYAELNRRANQVAWRLRALGVGHETLVGISVDRSADMLVGLLAILKAGGAYVPLDPGYPAERLALMIGDSAPPVVVSQRRLASLFAQHDVSTVLLDDPDSLDPWPTENLPTVSAADSLAYVSYTSGSTGTPKGVLATHGGVVNLVTAQNYVTVTPDDRVAALATLAFDASTFEVWAPLTNGATCVLYSFAGDDMSTLVEQVDRDAVSILHLTSPVFRLLEPRHFRALTRVHTLLFGGESVRSELGVRAAEAFRGTLIHLYGPTEATGFATFQAVRAGTGAAAQIPIGRPILHVHVRILDAAGQPVPDGAAGELYIGGRGVARGYLDRPAATAERFVPDPTGGPQARRYRTGDLVRLGDDGAIHFLGRLDRQIKVRGYRIEPGEIEAALTRHPDVRDAVLIARENGAGDKRLDAYVVPTRLDDDRQQLVAAVRAHIREILPRYQHPATLTVISGIPLTNNLKLDQSRLPVPKIERGSPIDRPVDPLSELETLLVTTWCETLDLDDVDLDDNFFELGGDSISAVHLATAVELATGRRVSVKDVFQHPTVRQLAGAVAAAGGATR